MYKGKTLNNNSWERICRNLYHAEVNFRKDIIRGHQITWYKTTKQQPAKRTKKLYIASQVFLHFCFRWQWRSVKLKIKAIIRKKNTPEKEVHCFFMLLCQNLKRERSNMNSGKKRWNTLGVLCGLQLKKYKKIFSKRKWNNKWSKQKEWPGKKGRAKVSDKERMWFDLNCWQCKKVEKKINHWWAPNKEQISNYLTSPSEAFNNLPSDFLIICFTLTYEETG